MKRLLLAAALGAAALLASPTDVQAQRTDSTYVKPQLPTGPPMVPPAPTRPAPTTRPAQPQPTQPQPTQPAPTTRPGGIDDDGRPAQTLPGTPAPAPAQPVPSTRPGGGIDDDGRPAQTLPQNGPVPGATIQKEYTPSKYFIYSNFSLGLNSNLVGGVSYNLGAAPALGYRLNSRVSFGPGIVYSYNRYTIPSANRGQGDPSGYSANNLGVKLFGQVIVYKQFFIHAEYEVTKAEILYEVLTGPNTLQVVKEKATVRTPLLGVGYRQQLGDRAATDIAVLYNFNNGLDANIYGQPVIRFSFLFDIGK